MSRDAKINVLAQLVYPEKWWHPSHQHIRSALNKWWVVKSHWQLRVGWGRVHCSSHGQGGDFESTPRCCLVISAYALQLQLNMNDTSWLGYWRLTH